MLCRFSSWIGNKVGVLIGVLLGTLIGVGGVLAINEFVLNVPSSVTVVNPQGSSEENTISLTSDSLGANRLINLYWGKIPRGTNQIEPAGEGGGWNGLGHRLYIKNLSGNNLTVKAAIDMPSSLGYGGGGLTRVGVGETREIGLWWHLSPTAPLGLQTFTVKFIATKVP